MTTKRERDRQDRVSAQHIERGNQMAGTSKNELIARVVAFYPQAEQVNWAHWYRGWTNEALRRQASALAAERRVKLHVVSAPDENRVKLVEDVLLARIGERMQRSPGTRRRIAEKIVRALDTESRNDDA